MMEYGEWDKKPLKLAKVFWPDVVFYREQRMILESLVENKETVVPAANMMGKDFTAGFAALWFFLTREPCRIVTTSAKDDHLRVLWGEINQFIVSSKYPLHHKDGGILLVNQREIKKIINGVESAKSYIKGMVASAETIAAMQGHHIAATGDGIPRTMFMSDESSSVPDQYYTMASTWANRMYIFGNTWPCSNFFKRAVKGNPKTKDRGGDLPNVIGSGLKRKVIRIKAEDSPNVRYALAEIKAGKKPSGRVIVPGVKQYHEYLENLRDWDEVQKCVSLNADWYEGADLLWFPPAWLNLAESRAEKLIGVKRQAKAIGVDTAEGGDETAVAIVDELGLIFLSARKTPNTAKITGWILALMKEYGVPPENVLFDRGGGGKEHVDRLREQGYNVRTVGFGESADPDIKHRGVMTTYEERIEESEEHYVYKSRRAEMHGILRSLLNPQMDEEGNPTREVFAIPRRYEELRRQLAPIPMWYDSEGRIYLPPKKLNPDAKDNIEKITIEKLIGCSPDQSDALILATFGLVNRGHQRTVKSMV